MPRYSLDNVTIDGFRGLKNLRLDNMGLINILVGPNNCGKTSVLEALSILCNATDPFEWVWVVRRRDFGGLDETRIQSLRWCFTQSGELTDPEMMFKGECNMTCDGQFPLTKLRVAYEEMEGVAIDGELGRLAKRRAGDSSRDLELDLEPSRGATISHYVESTGSLLRSGMAVPQPAVAQVWEYYPVPAGRPARSRSRAPTETLTPYSYQINKIQVRSYSRYLLGREKGSALKLIQEFDPEINGIILASLRGVRPAIHLEHRRLGSAPLSVFGDATRRAVLMAGTIPSLKGGGVLLIDEIETGIHASKLNRVLGWLARVARELRVQVVATTHSLEAVDAIALAIQDTAPDLVTFHLDQTKEQTTVKRIDADLLSRLRSERGLDVR
jgi:energy-coupling factor transporter ATP-binding protein EcfA2